jgi:hypothetical protein
VSHLSKREHKLLWISQRRKQDILRYLRGRRIPSHHTMVDDGDQVKVFEFPIQETNGETKMKNINPSSLPHFHGLTTKDLDTFLFEFVVVCRTYDYTSDEKKIKLFPSTLKESTLRWFMSLEGNNITKLDQMKQDFSNKYMDYCKERDTRDEIFRMTQGENESLGRL